MRFGLYLVIFASACGRLDFAPLTITSDSSEESAPGFGVAQSIAILDTAANDADPTVTADQLELYFSSDRPGGMGGTDIYKSLRATTTDAWGAPVLVTELSSPGSDDSPEISPDGLTLWQATVRGSTKNRVFVSTRADRGSTWGTPALVAELTSNAYDTNLAISGDGLIALVEHDAGGGDYDLYEHRRATIDDLWGPETHVAELATTSNESSPCLDEHGLVVWFTSNRPGTLGDYDIWTAQRASLDQPFSVPIRSTDLDSPLDDGNPFLSRDGHTMYWASSRAPTVGERDMWFATR